MQCTGGTRSTVRTAARTAALVPVAAALVTGGVAGAELMTTPSVPGPVTTAGPAGPATLVVALPHHIGASNRAW